MSFDIGDLFWADDEHFLREERKRACPLCPFQIMCHSGIWPKFAGRCAACECIAADPSDLAAPRVLCTHSTLKRIHAVNTISCPLCLSKIMVTPPIAPIYKGIRLKEHP